MNIFSKNSNWRHFLISSWCHTYNVIVIRRFNNMWPLSLCCSNNSQKCEWKIVQETQKTQIETQIIQKKQRKMTRTKTSIWKHDIAFLNFFINITFTTLVTFQILVLITLSTLRPWATSDVRFSSVDSHSNFWVTFSCF